MVFRRIYLLLLFLVTPCSPALSYEWFAPRSSAFVFAGQFMQGTFPGWVNIPYAEKPENNFLVGAAYGLQLIQFGNILVGTEVGVAGRFGDATAGEFWAGPSYRYRIHLGPVTVTPGIVAGFSVVTGTLGTERLREVKNRGNATLLFYLAPEIAFSFAYLSNVEFIFRVQHRSGAEGTLGRMGEGANANIFGVRWSL